MQEKTVRLSGQQKIYFASDFHLGSPSHEISLEREKKIITWLNQIRDDAHSIYLLGDIFDFWFEYKHAIPKGSIRLQGKLAELSDQGITICLFSGNHDIGMYRYFEEEIGAQVYKNPIVIKTGQHNIMAGHGDGLGNVGTRYTMMKKILTSSMTRWIFATIHPDLGLRWAQHISTMSRKANDKRNNRFTDKENEIIFQYCQEIEQGQHHDFYIFGHRHLPINLEINPNSRYINLGDWISSYTYAVYHSEGMELVKFQQATHEN